MSIQELIQTLRDAATELESNRVSNDAIKPDISLRDAWDKLAVFPARAIQVEVRQFKGTPTKVEFTVWDGKNHHTGPSLSTALRNALEVNSEDRPNEPVAVAEQFVGK